MIDSIPASTANRQPSPHRFRSRRAFTLVEVMMTVLFVTMVTIGVISSLVYCYRQYALIRYRDAARAMLVSFSDQFMRLSNSMPDGKGGFVSKPMFYVKIPPEKPDGPNGLGLSWNKVEGTVDGLKVKLGDPSSGQIDAVVTKEVFYLDENTGMADASDATTAAGYMLKGIFTIRYTYNERNYVETFTLARLIK